MSQRPRPREDGRSRESRAWPGRDSATSLAYVERADAVESATDDHQHRRSYAQRREELREEDEPDPSDAEVGDRNEPPRSLYPDEVQDDSQCSAQPDGYETHDANRAVERNERERRVGPGDEDEDHGVVEPSSPQPRRGAPPWKAVVESARTEHRSKRDRVHPHRETLEIPIGENDEERPGDDSSDERVLMEDTA